LVKVEKYLLILIVWIIGIAPISGALSYPRDFYQDAILPESLVNLIKQFLTPFLFLLILFALSLNFFRKRELKRKGIYLLCGLFLSHVGPVLAMKFGTVPNISLEIILVPTLFLTIYLHKMNEVIDLTKTVRKILLVYVYGTLVSMIILPDWSIQTNYLQGFIPGFDIRLHGVVNHSNNLAPLLLFYLLLDYLNPQKGVFSIITKTIVLIEIILTQSKTTWVILVVGAILVAAYKFLKVSGRRKLFRLSITFFVSGISIILIILIINSQFIQSFFVTNSDGIFTLTGRTKIWEYTLAIWKQNPIIGYGNLLWGEDMRLAYGGYYHWTPAHAHNQVIQTLGESGIVGLIGLLIYFLILSIYSIRISRVTKGVSLVILILLFIRSFSEPVLRNNVQDPNFLIHFIVFTFVLLHIRTQTKINLKPRRNM
jgi:exopolysaccharide production protein ExoQ